MRNSPPHSSSSLAAYVSYRETSRESYASVSEASSCVFPRVNDCFIPRESQQQTENSAGINHLEFILFVSRVCFPLDWSHLRFYFCWTFLASGFAREHAQMAETRRLASVKGLKEIKRRELWRARACVLESISSLFARGRKTNSWEICWIGGKLRHAKTKIRPSNWKPQRLPEILPKILFEHKKFMARILP